MNDENKTEGKHQRIEYSLKSKNAEGIMEEVGIPWWTEEYWATIPEERKSIRYICSDTSE